MSENFDKQSAERWTRRTFLRASATTAVAAGVSVQAFEMMKGESETTRPWINSDFMPNPLETRILGANTFLGESKAGLRIVALDHRDGTPVRFAGVRVSILVPDEKSKTTEVTLFKGYTNRRGTVDANFEMPPLPKGSYDLKVNTNSSLGTDSFTSPITVTDAAQILLTTDKPLYQPGQTIHLRALSLAKPDQKPVADKPVTFEVEDSKGNKVFKKDFTTSQFGVAATDFVLGNEINLGRYTVRAILGDVINEKKVTVDKYVLPKFKVSVTTDKKYYLPGETLKGTAQADYFFGKSVVGGEVNIKLSTFDVGFNDFAELKGKTDANGTYKFETKLPNSFVGLPLEQGNAFVKIETDVKDKAEHHEKITTTVPVAKDPIKITVVPESGALVPGVENLIYILTAYPDGAPAPSRFNLKSAGIDLSGTTDKLGIGEVRLTPQQGLATPTAGQAALGQAIARPMVEEDVVMPPGIPGSDNSPQGPPLPVTITASDMQGNNGTASTQISRRVTDESLVVRTDKAVAKVGDALGIEIISTRQNGTAYVDLIKDGQTVLTQSVSMQRGRGDLNIDLDATLAGTLQAHAYIITPRGDIVRDTKIVYVNPANDLKISVSADKDTYRPGTPAKINLKVTDERGHPVLAALGVNIVDESVFALQEMQPGMEKIYFTLEKELLEPKVEVHGFSAEEIVPTAGEKPRLNPEKQKVARVLFAAAQPLVNFGINWNSFEQKQQSVSQKWYERVTKDATKFSKALDTYNKKHGRMPEPEKAIDSLVNDDLLTRADLKDPLGSSYTILPRYGAKDFSNGFIFASPGIDRKIGTSDDITVAGYPGGYVGSTFGRFIGGNGLRGDKDLLRFEEPAMLAADEAMPMAPAGAGGEVFKAERHADVVNGPVATSLAAGPSGPAAKPDEEPVRIRQYFPETLYANPNGLTDERGNAVVNLDMADSITTWRLTTMASSAQGSLGSTTSPIRVFQDFFVDIDLPVSLTQNDEVSIPVAVYNYLPQPQTVRLKLETEPGNGAGKEGKSWFELVSDDSAEKSINMDANQVGVVHYNIRANQIGDHKLTVTARGTKLSDAVQRSIEVVPDGKETVDTFNDRLEDDVTKNMVIPAGAIPDASNIIVRVYPGAFSQVVDGLDKILQMPYGCFEQNASVAYPNILVMDYLKKTKQLKPELEMKAESYINAGYQRALTYEVKTGGFSWFGAAPAHKVLTAYGILMFNDMSRVHFVDPNVISRTQNWLAGQQKADGSWEVDQGGIAEGIINRQTDVLRVTAYVTWALAETNYRGPQLSKAANYISARIGDATDAYALAVICNALVSLDKNSEAAQRALEKLVGFKTEEAKVAYWKNATTTFTGAQSDSADIETTGLAVYALLRSGKYMSLVNKVLTYLVQKKDPSGTWGSTQGTVWSLRSLLAGMDKAAGETNGEVIVKINGAQAGAFAITPKDADVMRQVDLKEHVREGENTVEIKFAGKGSALYGISSKYYVPWPAGKEISFTEKPPLDVDVNYDRTELAVNDIVTCRVRATNHRPATANMIIIDVGIPPGFEVQAEDLAELVGSKKIMKFSLTGRTAIIYLEKIDPNATVSLNYRLKAKFPLKAKSPKSVVYEYYTPNRRGESKPVALTVKA